MFDAVLLRTGAKELGVELDEKAIARFEQISIRMEEVNQSLNLTRIPPDEYITMHYLDSLTLAAVRAPMPDAKVLDVGSGAGFPGLPLAIAFPETQFTLLDGTRKRLNYLDALIAELELTNVRTVLGRSEELEHLLIYKGRFELVTARAVAKMNRLAGWLMPFVRPTGFAVAWKTLETDQELKEAEPAIRKAGGEVARISPVTIPGADIQRRLVFLKKWVRPR